MSNGHFFVIEGVDGSGKTTQLQRLMARFDELGLPFHKTAEPTDRPIGKMIRSVLQKELTVSSASLAALFVADRLDHLDNAENGMLMLLNSGTHVLSDRYYLSSYAYQSLDHPMDWVIGLNSKCAEMLRPTISFFLDLPVEISMSRIESRGGEAELFEQQTTMERVRANFHAAIERVSADENIVLIDANQPVDAVFDAIWAEVEKVLG